MGQGAYGEVNLVKKKDTDEQYAIKIIMKHNKTGRANFMETVFNERDILGHLKNIPQIVKLYAAFQDQENLYFLLELGKNGSLRSLIQNKREEL